MKSTSTLLAFLAFSLIGLQTQAQTLLEEVKPDDFDYNFLVQPVFLQDASGSSDYYCYLASGEKLLMYQLKSNAKTAIASSGDDSHKKNIAQYGLASNGKELVTVGEDNSVKVWTSSLSLLCTVQERATEYSYQSGMGAAGISPAPTDSRIAYAMYSENPKEGTIVKVYDYIAKKEIAVLKGHGKELLRKIVFSDNGKYIASSSDNEAIVWEAATGKIMQKISGKKVCIHTFMVEGEVFVVEKDQQMFRMNTESGAATPFEQPFEGSSLTFIAYEPYLRVVAGQNTSLKMWNPGTGKLIATAQYNGMLPQYMLLLPNGELALAIGSSKMQLFKLDW